ncbi:TonB-dependent siderophore receptor [Pseudomonas sp. PDM14]|uniref:TonB-dependent siderophore receptor n=1 Tax=Pseudomonas sp. PDM14 TaxID=2769288 RepID=UPI001CE2113C|nr:TonB-dependent siderophore receptor [Pseudomonas sp. PDM14]
MSRHHLSPLAAAIAFSLCAHAVHAEQANTAKTKEKDAAIELQQLDINAQGVRGQATTEGTKSYTTGVVNSSTKLPMSLRETPQSVSVITRQRMEDQGMGNLNDVVKNTTGLSVQKYGPERQRYVARGFTVDNIMYDGLPMSVSTYSQDVITAADTAMFDRIEIVRGATGLMQGAGNPSAAINMVRKRPTITPQLSVGASAGSWDRYRTELDASGALNETGTIRGRIVTAYEDNGTYLDQGGSEHGVLYAISELDLTESTMLTLGSSYQNDNKDSDWGGLPTARDGSDLDLPRSTYLGNDWAYWNTSTTHLFGELDHRFDNDWKLHLAGDKMWGRINMLGSYLGYDNNGLQQSSGKYTYVNDYDSYDGYVSGPFALLGRTHELVVGASNRKEIFDGHGGWLNTPTGPNIDPKNWDSGMVPEPSFDMRRWGMKFEAEQKGVYATTRLNIADPLKVILGGRLDWYDHDGGTPQSSYKVTRNVTRYAGVIYDLNETYSVYASYTDIFKPQTNLDPSYSILEPMTGTNYEFGIKGEYLDGALNASAAFFQINQENRAKLLDKATYCPTPTYATNFNCYEAAGEVESKGIDLELTGALTENWQLSAGYTYVEAKYKKDSNKANEGKLFDPDQPRHLFKLSTTYHLPGDLNKWRVGGSLNSQNAIYNEGGAGAAAWRIEQDAYTLVDLMLGYKVAENVDTRVNFNNVFDKKYYSGIGSTANVLYGEPRNAMFSVKWTL